MSSIDVTEALASLDAAVQAVGALDWDALTVREQLTAMGELETARRRAAACSHDLTAAVARHDEQSLGGVRHRVIADVLRITPALSRRRLRDASQLTPQATLSGQALPPQLPATAKAWDAGLLDADHLRCIQSFLRDLPEDVSPVEVEKAEAFLAEQATLLRPDQLEKVAAQLAIRINPDGKFSDDYRAAQRGFLWCGGQRADGMSVAKLVATPELRAMLEAWLAKFAAPGMCNPADQIATTAGQPSQQAVDGDRRGTAQRQHDAIAALLRGQLGDPKLGQHNGLPVTVIVSATLDQLQSAAGHAVSGCGTLLPVPDLIRMASHAWHYLCVFETHSQRPIYLGRSKRIATADQRIVLHAKERGCSAPGCTMPGYLTEVHHINEW
ncbi:MAG: 13E12 repeat family protein, partial [Mycobacterium sp.]